MKMSKILSLVLVLAMLVSCCAALTSCGKKETITIWVSETTGVAEKTQEQVNRFLAAHPEYDYEIKIETVTEADAGSKVVADVASAPDIYCFAQDQLARLVQASALLAPGQNATATIKAQNDAGSVAAASVAGKVWCYPMTSDNGYYLYYDTSVITNPESLEQIIADCEAAYAEAKANETTATDNYLFRFALENAWYTASFFFATGCTSTWTTREDGEFTAVQDDFNSAKGMIAMKGMQKLASSEIYDSDADKYANAAAWVTGIWNANKAEEHFGDNFGVTDLPSFTVDGQSYHLGSYSGNKLMGVKPQADAERAAFCSALALYLTNEECQMERYNLVQWGPSNLAAQQSEAVQANPSLAALAKQNAYATPQPQIFGGWWDIAKLLGSVAKSAKTDADLQAGLDNYKNTIDGLMALTPEQRQAFTVIGSINGSGWGTDFEMTQDAEGAWVSNDAFTLTETDEFKVRKGFAWDVAYGDNVQNADTSIPTSNKANYKVTTPGTYYIKLVVNSDGTAEITLVPAN